MLIHWLILVVKETVHRVQVEPEYVGWSRISDSLRQKDKSRIEDAKEDIDSLLVFVSRISILSSA